MDILVVEPDPPSGRLMRAMLTRCGHPQIRLVQNGIEALSEVCRRHPDCIFTEIILPRMNGLLATTIIRDYETALHRQAYIVGVSTFAMPGIRQACTDAGLNAYVSKPLHLSDLKHILRTTYFTTKKSI